MKNNIIRIVLVFATTVTLYLLYGHFVLQPQSFQHFSLIDDGQSIKYSRDLKKCFIENKCEDMVNSISVAEGGRSRIVYWLIQGFLYQGNGSVDATYQHSLRIYLFGGLMVILFSIISLLANAHPAAILLGIALFVTNYSFSENIIRLGPIEPYQIIFLALFSILFLYKDKIFKNHRKLGYLLMILSFTVFLLSKETSMAVLPVIVLLKFIFPRKYSFKELLLIFLPPTIIFILAKMLLGHGSGVGAVYVSEYNLSPLFVLQNAKNYILTLSTLTLPFMKLSIVVFAVGLLTKNLRKHLLSYELFYWVFLTGTLTAIYFPWKYVLDRYLLMSVFALSLSVTILFTKVINFIESYIVSKIYKFIFVFLLLLIFSNIYFQGAPLNIAKTINYRNWYSSFIKYESDQVGAISRYADKETVYLNATDTLDNWEVLFEIPLHLKYLYEGNYSVERAGDNYPTSGYLFSSTSLQPIYKNSKLLNRYKLLESRSYTINQINPLLFRQGFVSRPLQTLANPPLINPSINYYWEMRKIR